MHASIYIQLDGWISIYKRKASCFPSPALQANWAEGFATRRNTTREDPHHEVESILPAFFLFPLVISPTFENNRLRSAHFILLTRHDDYTTVAVPPSYLTIRILSSRQFFSGIQIFSHCFRTDFKFLRSCLSYQTKYFLLWRSFYKVLPQQIIQRGHMQKSN